MNLIWPGDELVKKKNNNNKRGDRERERQRRKSCLMYRKEFV